MGITTRYGIYSAKVHCAGDSAAANLGGITSERLTLANTVSADTTSGSVSPTQVNLLGVQPTGQFGTKSIAAWLTALGQRSKVISADVSHPGVVLYGQQHATGSTRKSGTNHSSYTIKNGMLYPTRLSCDHQADATLDVALMATYDGTNLPIIVDHAAALATLGTDAARFGLGPITLGGQTFTGMRNVSIDFGNSCEADGSDGDVYPTMCSLLESAPTITISGVNPAWFGASVVPMSGLVLEHADTTIYFRKRERGSASGYEADDGGAHVAITAAGLATLETVLDGSGTGRTTTALKIHTVFDGTNLPLVLDLAADLP